MNRRHHISFFHRRQLPALGSRVHAFHRIYYAYAYAYNPSHQHLDLYAIYGSPRTKSEMIVELCKMGQSNKCALHTIPSKSNCVSNSLLSMVYSKRVWHIRHIGRVHNRMRITRSTHHLTSAKQSRWDNVVVSNGDGEGFDAPNDGARWKGILPIKNDDLINYEKYISARKKVIWLFAMINNNNFNSIDDAWCFSL